MRWLSVLCLTALLATPHALADTPQPAAQTAAAADEAILASIMEGMKTTYADVQALQADFVQITRSPTFGDGPAQPGTITIARPRQMRVDFTGPSASQFITDGQTLWVYSPANNQVIITPDLSEQSDGLSDLLSNLSALQEKFTVELLSHDDDIAKIALTPKAAFSAQYQSVRVEISRADSQLTRLEMTDAMGSTTEMRMTKTQLNPTLSTNLFTFEPPPGAEIIRTDQF